METKLITYKDKELFDAEYLITECCLRGPITDENYCPNCGKKIVREKLIDYNQLKTEEYYNKLLSTGMFWEFHPELTGNWNEDSKLIKN